MSVVTCSSSVIDSFGLHKALDAFVKRPDRGLSGSTLLPAYQNILDPLILLANGLEPLLDLILRQCSEPGF